MATKLKPLSWDNFLKSKPVLTQARDLLPDDEFVNFVKRIPWLLKGAFPYNKRNILWHALAQLGLPIGGFAPCRCSSHYILEMFRMGGPNQPTVISASLVEDVERGRVSRGEVLSAAFRLQAKLDEISSTYNVPHSLNETGAWRARSEAKDAADSLEANGGLIAHNVAKGNWPEVKILVAESKQYLRTLDGILKGAGKK
jgi:hypothetical protein